MTSDLVALGFDANDPSRLARREDGPGVCVTIYMSQKGLSKSRPSGSASVLGRVRYQPIPPKNTNR